MKSPLQRKKVRLKTVDLSIQKRLFILIGCFFFFGASGLLARPLDNKRKQHPRYDREVYDIELMIRAEEDSSYEDLIAERKYQREQEQLGREDYIEEKFRAAQQEEHIREQFSAFQAQERLKEQRRQNDERRARKDHYEEKRRIFYQDEHARREFVEQRDQQKTRLQVERYARMRKAWAYHQNQNKSQVDSVLAGEQERLPAATPRK